MNNTQSNPEKAPEIRSVMRAVERSALGDSIESVDHWTADRHAIGFRKMKKSTPLVYVSTWKQPKGHYYYSLERVSGHSGEEGVIRGLPGLIRLLSRSLVGRKRTATRASAKPAADQRSTRSRSA